MKKIKTGGGTTSNAGEKFTSTLKSVKNIKSNAEENQMQREQENDKVDMNY